MNAGGSIPTNISPPKSYSCGNVSGNCPPVIHQYYSGSNIPTQTQTQHPQDNSNSVILGEIKSAISNVTECILNIADVITSKQEKEKPDPPKDENKSQEEVAPALDGQTVVVEADVHRAENDESISSCDGAVPDITGYIPDDSQSLNC